MKNSTMCKLFIFGYLGLSIFFTPLANANDLAGLKFGVGVSLTVDQFGAKDRVESAQIVNGIVRVEDENNSIARILLESHYFFKPEEPLFGVATDEWGWGPFVALQPGDEQTIDAVALGLMIGFLKDKETGSSWNIGIGIIVDPNTRVLGDGLEPNEATSETEIRYKEETETGLLIMTSFSF